jgi:hypothetical protein
LICSFSFDVKKTSDLELIDKWNDRGQKEKFNFFKPADSIGLLYDSKYNSFIDFEKEALSILLSKYNHESTLSIMKFEQIKCTGMHNR